MKCSETGKKGPPKSWNILFSQPTTITHPANIWTLAMNIFDDRRAVTLALLIILALSFGGCATSAPSPSATEAKKKADDAKKLEAAKKLDAELFQAADTLYRQGEYDKAIGKANEAVGKNPDNVDAIFLIGVIHHRGNRYQEALTYYRMTVEKKPSHMKAHYNLGIIYSDNIIDLPESIAHLKKFLELSPPPDREKEAKLLLAKVEGRMQALSGAGFQNTHALSAPAPAVSSGNTGAPPQQNKTPKAAKSGSKGSKGDKKGHSKEKVSSPSSDIQKMALIAEADATGDIDEKMKLYQKAIEMDKSLYDIRVKLGQLYETKENDKEAENIYSKIIEDSPSYEKAHKALINLLDKAGRTADLAAACEKLTVLRPGLPWAWERLGMARQTEGNAQAAKEAYRKGLQFNPKQGSTHFLLANLLDKTKSDANDAVKHYKEYLKLEPNGPQASKARDRIEQLSK